MTVLIHGREYITVAERLIKAHSELKEISITTEVLYIDPVVIKATVTTPKGIFTGISAANPVKSIEKESPFEVAESSAVGRALAFAGYETTNGIASAEEMQKATRETPVKTTEVIREPITTEMNECSVCGVPVKKPYTKCWKCSQIKKL